MYGSFANIYGSFADVYEFLRKCISLPFPTQLVMLCAAQCCMHGSFTDVCGRFARVCDSFAEVHSPFSSLRGWRFVLRIDMYLWLFCGCI